MEMEGERQQTHNLCIWYIDYHLVGSRIIIYINRLIINNIANTRVGGQAKSDRTSNQIVKSSRPMMDYSFCGNLSLLAILTITLNIILTHI